MISIYWKWSGADRRRIKREINKALRAQAVRAAFSQPSPDEIASWHAFVPL